MAGNAPAFGMMVNIVAATMADSRVDVPTASTTIIINLSFSLRRSTGISITSITVISGTIFVANITISHIQESNIQVRVISRCQLGGLRRLSKYVFDRHLFMGSSQN